MDTLLEEEGAGFFEDNSRGKYVNNVNSVHTTVLLE